ncbi:MAG TPA: hypothetical protein VL486_03610 [Verrucomicrobiae bacterium]|nr:hypothetical protein [Verrucomicrobiae bacterium]
MKAGDGTGNQSETAQAILAYLLEHPAAEDTLEGIAEWWLLQHNIKRQTDEVKTALAALVASGLVIERPVGGTASLYRLNWDKLDGLRALRHASGNSN